MKLNDIYIYIYVQIIEVTGSGLYAKVAVSFFSSYMQIGWTDLKYAQFCKTEVLTAGRVLHN